MSCFKGPMRVISGPCNGLDPLCDEPETAAVKAKYPLTHNQQGIWLEQSLDPLSTQFNLIMEWDLSKEGQHWDQCTVQALTAIQLLTRKYSVLRSTIVVENGTPYMQEFEPSSTCPSIQFVTNGDAHLDTRAIMGILRRAFRFPEDLAVRWCIVRLQSGIQLYLTAHHIAVDGGSMSLLSKEFLEIYRGGSTTTDDSTMDFSQAHIAEQNWMSSDECKQAAMTWMSQMSNTCLTRWSFPDVASSESCPRSSNSDYRGITTWANFSRAELSAWSDTYRTSWFRVAVSIIGLLVNSFSKPSYRKDHVLGVAFAARPKGFETSPGQFASPLPVKIPLWDCLLSAEDRPSLKELVTAVSRTFSQVKKHERLSLLDIAKNCRENGIDFHPCKVAVSYSPKLAEDSCRLFPVEGNWDLFFVLLENDLGIELGVVYDPLIFSNDAILAMKDRFQQLVGISFSNPDVSLNSLPSIPKHVSLPRLDPIDDDLPVWNLFELHATTNPTAVALLCAETGEQMTYGELLTASNAKASELRSGSVHAEVPVLLHLRRGFLVVEWILAAMKAGGAFVYVDPKLPTARKESILATSKPAVLVTDDYLDGKETWLANFSGHVLSSSVNPTIPQDHYQESLWPRSSPSDLAYIIYTSGSTGQPKGVMIEHGHLTRFVKASTSTYNVGYGSRVLQFANFTFDASILEWSTTLVTGATLCFAKYPQALMGDYLADVIDKNSITFMQITPTALGTIPASRSLKSLSCISLGGEPVPGQMIQKWQEQVDVVNSYGLTETTIAVAFKKYRKRQSAKSFNSVGTPPDGTSLYICDPKFTEILPNEHEGEICIAGSQVGRGYRGQPELTNQKFALHPTLGERLYRTGDHGRITSTGELQVLGRIDRELKVRGFRIAPEDIEEAMLCSNAGVGMASVQQSQDGLALVAFVAPLESDTEALLGYLRSKLPSYMVPSTIHKCRLLPLNTNGKVDHKRVNLECRDTVEPDALVTKPSHGTASTPDDANPTKDGSSVESDVKIVVAEIWRGLLNLSETPEYNINFFDIGGHSLLVPRLLEKLNVSFPGSNLRTVDLFHQATIREQAALVAPAAAVPSVKPKNTARILNGEDPSAQAAPPRNSPVKSTDIAIVGIGGRFPGAKNPEELYANLMQGQVSIQRSTSTSAKSHVDGCLWVPKAGTLSEVEDFDYRFWKLSKEEATDMDPQQRLFLEVALEALDDAELDPFQSARNNIGVFVGSAQNKYHTFTDPVYGSPFERANRGFVAPSISARTAYHLNLHGPNITLNTNCASSTVALSLAVESLRNHKCDAAIVGGISVQLFDGGYITQEGQIFSSKGQCRPFDAEADGTVPSDAVVALVLKRLPDVLKEGGGTAYSVILGTAIGSDGRTQKAGYQVPSPRGQAEVIKNAWKDSGIPVTQLSYTELHGSGTPFGDALELEGLGMALRELGYYSYSTERRRCVVGSNKGNLGNTQHASGLVSVVKMCKSIEHGVVPAIASLQTLNPVINDTKLQFEFATSSFKLSPKTVVAVSAAGWGGVNSHIILATPAPEILRSIVTRERLKPRKFNRETLSAPRMKQASFSSNNIIPDTDLKSSRDETVRAILALCC
ncbi:hypothetical protein MPDQ_001039 [Monascus purpureus]|uniref:Uncharacterized protein n=1 Tax=Monascus purpureus TaxID=5098 RepID=A0A507QSM7_MONPU|nr:hypothetical protein MPDQ_001039 [Monascus purpureus]BDD57852.1 putative Hybrid PKS-NRPS biosynthetic cluster [Monascus purpureus]